MTAGQEWFRTKYCDLYANRTVSASARTSVASGQKPRSFFFNWCVQNDFSLMELDHLRNRRCCGIWKYIRVRSRLNHQSRGTEKITEFSVEFERLRRKKI